MKIDFSKPIISERDPFRGEAYCIECFSPRKGNYLYFYNSQGPFCCKQCFADFVGIFIEDLPRLEFRANVRD